MAREIRGGEMSWNGIIPVDVLMKDNALEIAKEYLSAPTHETKIVISHERFKLLAEAVVKQSEALRDAEGVIKMCDDFFKLEQKYLLEIVTSAWIEKYELE